MIDYPPHAALLRAFNQLFEGTRYKHRSSTLGNWVAEHLYEDMLTLGKSNILTERVSERRSVVNRDQRVVGRMSRRGDGTFGELVPGVVALTTDGFQIPRGPVATVEIGVETKIMAKAMIKQIDRVISDLCRQVEHFKATSPDAICVAFVGVNHADHYVGYEGDRPWPTDGSGTYRHPIQEAAEATQRLNDMARPAFNEFQLLPFRATNEDPFPFEWCDFQQTRMEYAALLTRLSVAYDRLVR